MFSKSLSFVKVNCSIMYLFNLALLSAIVECTSGLRPLYPAFVNKGVIGNNVAVGNQFSSQPSEKMVNFHLSRRKTFNTSSKAASEEEQNITNAVEMTENERKLGNLVADDEWLGLSMEISELVRVAIVEDLKKQTRDFIGKEDYKIGDIAKEIDDRVKKEVALFRGKEEYELGDLSIALDTISKEITCQLTGKDKYEFGDLSKEIDKRLKAAVCRFCEKDEGEGYEFGDLSKEIDRRVKNTVAEFTSKGNYEFGDVSREIERRRSLWVKGFLGKDDYQFGDITKKAVSNLTGKESYEFGDISKKLLGDVFGKRKRGGDSNK